MSERMYSLAEAAQRLGVSMCWLHELRKRGIVKAKKTLGRVQIPESAIEAARGRCTKGGPRPSKTPLARAAPELLAALEGLIEWYDRDGSVGGIVEPIDVARAAIASAKGPGLPVA